MEDKITIIEGPAPTFEATSDLWVQGLAESSLQSEIVTTRLRTFDGQDLVERCRRAWRNQQNIQLEYRTLEGFPDEVPIVAARSLTTEEGDLLILWVRFPETDVELSIDYAEEDDYDEDDDFFFGDEIDTDDDEPF